MKAFAHPGFDTLYCAYYILGVGRYTGHPAAFSATPFANADTPSPPHSLPLVVNGRRIFIDAGDGPRLSEPWLNWCDAYGKINADLAQYSASQRAKIVPIGPSFGIRVWNITSTVFHLLANYAACRQHTASKREFIANYLRQYWHRLPLSCYRPQIIRTDIPAYVFFAGTAWAREAQTNAFRLSFIKACKGLPWLHFEGGFAPRIDRSQYSPAEYIMAQRYSLRQYLRRTHRSTVVFNTPAVVGCHGWKLGEFLAMGKAIISTPLQRDLLPALVHGEHIHYVDGSEGGIATAVAAICQNDAYRQKLELGARSYYSAFLAPERIIARLTEHRCPCVS